MKRADSPCLQEASSARNLPGWQHSNTMTRNVFRSAGDEILNKSSCQDSSVPTSGSEHRVKMLRTRQHVLLLLLIPFHQTCFRISLERKLESMTIVTSLYSCSSSSSSAHVSPAVTYIDCGYPPPSFLPTREETECYCAAVRRKTETAVEDTPSESLSLLLLPLHW